MADVAPRLAHSSPGGALQLQAQVRDGQFTHVALHSTRPKDIGRLLIDRRADKALALVPLLFAVCGAAHRAAARAALHDAAGVSDLVSEDHARAAAAETAFGLAWRTQMVWAPLLGLAPDLAGLRTLKEQPSPAVARLLAGDRMVLDGLSSQIATVADGGLRAALEAQVAEHESRLAHLVLTDPHPPATPDAGLSSAVLGALGCGEGRTETARGELLHRVCLVQGCVASWHIEAPTDRVFAPAGPVVALLEGASAGADPRATLALTMAVFDPCVPFSVQLLAEPAHA